MKTYRLIIFDADGTLTPMRGSAVGPFSFALMPGVKEKCAALRKAGTLLAIASNQSPRRDHSEIMAQMNWTQARLGTARALFEMRRQYQKPSPFMLNDLMRYYFIEPEDTLFVGDQDTDRQAAEAAGVAFAWAADFFGGGQ